MLYKALIHVITKQLIQKNKWGWHNATAFWCIFDYKIDLSICCGFCIIGPFLKILFNWTFFEVLNTITWL